MRFRWWRNGNGAIRNRRLIRTILPCCLIVAGTLGGVLLQEGQAEAAPSVWTWTGAIGPYADAVSCTSPTSCVAVGSGSTYQLNGVSCISSTSCVAVGYSIVANETAIESWNGTAWSVVPSPNLSGSLSQLRSVSCSSSNRCIAVGSYYNRTDTTVLNQTLIESWNGTACWLYPAQTRAGRSVQCRAPVQTVA